MPERSSRLPRAFALAIVALLVLAGVGVLAVRSFLTPDRLRAEVTRSLHDATGLEVTLGEVSLSFLPLGVVISDLRIAGAAGDPPLLELDRALGRLELGPLLRRSIVVSRLALTRPRVFLRQGPDGLELPGKLGSSPSGAAPPSLPPAAIAPAAAGFGGAIRSFEIDEGALRIATPEGRDDVELRGVALRGTLDVEPGARTVRSRGTLSLGGLSLAALEPYRETLDRLEPEVRFDVELHTLEGRVALDSLRLVAPPLDLPFHGEIRALRTQPHVSLSLESRTLEIAELLPLVPRALLPAGREPSGRGPVTLSARYEATPGDPGDTPRLDVDLGFRGDELALSGVPAAVGDLRGDVRLAPGRLEITDLSGTLDGKPFRLGGSVDGLAGNDAATYDLAARGTVDLSLLDRAALAPPGLGPSGSADFDLRARGSLAASAPAEVTGTIDLVSVGAAVPELPVRAEDWNGSLEMAGADLVVKRLIGRLGRSSFEMKGRVRQALTDPTVELEGRSAYLDLAEIAPTPEAAAAAPLVPLLPSFPLQLRFTADSVRTEDAVMAGVSLTTNGASGSGHAVADVRSADLDGMTLRDLHADLELQGGSATGSFRAANVDAYDVPLAQVAGTLRAGEDRILHLENLTGALWGGTAEGTVRMDLTDPDSPGFDIRTTATGVQAGGVLTALTPARDVLQGTLDLSSSFSGKGTTPREIAAALTGQGTLDARNGKLEATPATRAVWQALQLQEQEAIPFRDLATAFAVRDGKLVTDDLRLEGGNATWAASGSVAFDGTLDYHVEVELNDELSSLYRKRLGSDLAALLAGSSGRLVIDLDVRGNARDPVVTVDQNKLAERARQNLGDKARNELKKLFGGK